MRKKRKQWPEMPGSYRGKISPALCIYLGIDAGALSFKVWHNITELTGQVNATFWVRLARTFIVLAVSNILGVPEFLKPEVQTEYYIKIGLVVMGFSVLFSNIVNFGLYGLAIA
ncbi:MAG: hypothetical protein IJG65_05545 [Synergistaceae bacterium]|nr:hypothetical protein [Synergistaceae bacterium]